MHTRGVKYLPGVVEERRVLFLTVIDNLHNLQSGRHGVVAFNLPQADNTVLSGKGYAINDIFLPPLYD